MKVRKHAWFWLALSLILWLAVAPGCGGRGAEADTGEESATGSGSEDAAEEASLDDDADEPEAVPVEVVTLGLGPIESILKSTATLEAESQVKVFSEAQRKVTALLVEEGDRVRRGQLLVRLQDDEQRTTLAKVANELEKAEREYKRQERLHAEKLISEEAFNNATFELEQLRLSLEEAERQLSYTEVRAPIAGTVTQRKVNLGDQVNIGQELFEVVDFDSIVARIFVPEKSLLALRPGLAARVTTPASLQKQYRGRVDRIAPVVDAASGTVKVTVALGGQPGLRPGMYVDVELVLDTRPNALLIPKKALVYDEEQVFAYRVDDDRIAHKLEVIPELTDRNHVLPANGFAEGDRIIVAGQAGLKDGAKVVLPEDEIEDAEQESRGEVAEVADAAA